MNFIFLFFLGALNIGSSDSVANKYKIFYNSLIIHKYQKPTILVFAAKNISEQDIIIYEIKNPAFKKKLKWKKDYKVKRIINKQPDFFYKDYDIFEITLDNVHLLKKFHINIKNQVIDTITFKFIDREKLLSTLLSFIKAQRCGFEQTHKERRKCHLNDSKVIIKPFAKNKIDTIFEKSDLIGGWHDAGDYIKFLTTAAYSVYILSLAVELTYEKNSKLYPQFYRQLLEEIEYGTRWLSKLNYKDQELIAQIQDEKDHNYGFRKPELDTLVRPAIINTSKNLIGIYSAALAAASRVLEKDKRFGDLSLKAIKLSRHFFSLYDNYPDNSFPYSYAYYDTNYVSKLSLAAIELFETTGDTLYLIKALEFAKRIDPDYWHSWGNINGIVFFKLTKYDSAYLNRLEKNILYFNETSNRKIFGEAIDFAWGTNLVLSGAALQSLLWKTITCKSDYELLAWRQANFLLGFNYWRNCFIKGYGKKNSHNLHSQLNLISNEITYGAVAAGPSNISAYHGWSINYLVTSADDLSNYGVYFDVQEDFISNEPSIALNSTVLAMFLLLFNFY